MNFDIDLTGHETQRLAVVLAGYGPAWDPAAALAQEQAAERLLYNNLDLEQTVTYERLVNAGILPARGPRAA